MTMIVPAGNKKIDWSPKETKLEKTAATSVSQDIEDNNPLYIAAKKYLEAKADGETCDTGKKCPCECIDDKCKEDKKEVKAGTEFGAKPANEAPANEAPLKDESGAIIEIETPEGEKKEDDGKDKIEVAVEKIDDAVVELKDAVGMVNEAEEEEVEIEIDDISAPSIPGKEDSKDGLLVESDPMSNCACAEKQEVEINKEASTDDDFCKYAKLSPANKMKLAKYWKDLGFPKEYVDLMTKDYEK